MAAMPQLNPWETCALQYKYPDQTPQSNSGEDAQSEAWRQNPAADPVMYPGLYCPSGFDMMSILLRVISRPDPKVELGPIDCSVALILCDLHQPDTPIVYVSDPFCQLTGYAKSEVIGRNCRFLQAPGGAVRKSTPRKHVGRDILRAMGRSVERNEELQLQVMNFKKNGMGFVNLLTMIPVRWDSEEFRYSVGFQCEAE